jgi:hypothetical protein
MTRYRVDWWRVTVDLQRCGVSLSDVSDLTLIPRSTLLGYRNLDVEPRHADGEALLALWRQHMPGMQSPMKPERLRQRALQRI